jgi:hypothetical protein
MLMVTLSQLREISTPAAAVATVRIAADYRPSVPVCLRYL